jgi:hypothetical protein
MRALGLLTFSLGQSTSGSGLEIRTESATRKYPKNKNKNKFMIVKASYFGG